MKLKREYITNPSQLQEPYIMKNYPEDYIKLLEYPQDYSFKERLYLYFEGLVERPRCLVCGKPLTGDKFRNTSIGYLKYCCSNCSKIGSIQNMKQTKLEKYGDENYNNSSSISKTKLKKYGDEGVKNEFISKVKQTKLAKYGDENYVNKELIKTSLNERYSDPEKKRDMINNIFQTREERYGDKNWNNRDKYKETFKKHFLETHPDILDVRYEGLGASETIYVCKDGDDIFEIPSIVYWVRINSERSINTHKYPVSKDETKNTYPELFIQNYLNELHVDYICNDRKKLNGKELDLYIPSKQMAIEANGVYWHCDQNKTKDYHIKKYKECQSKRIQLLSVWEDWIISKPDIVRGIISSKLGIYNERIFARKCTIKEIDSCSKFLNQYHIQGNCPSKIKIGLFYNDELVSIMTFGQRKNGLVGKKYNDGDWELLRFCNKCGVQVVGGASRLLKYFISHYNPSTITSFSSNDISDGNLYKKLGFEYGGENSSYWYIKDYKRYHRTSFTKSSLVKEGFNPEKSEKEIMMERGFYRIYDSGQTKWILKI